MNTRLTFSVVSAGAAAAVGLVICAGWVELGACACGLAPHAASSVATGPRPSPFSRPRRVRDTERFRGMCFLFLPELTASTPVYFARPDHLVRTTQAALQERVAPFSFEVAAE